MEHYAGIDVSLELSSVCVVDAQGKIVRETKVASEPEALVAFFASLGFAVKRIGLEAGPLSQWLFAAMTKAGLAVELLESTVIDRLPGFRKRMNWFLEHRQDLARHISYMQKAGHDGHSHYLLAIPSEDRLRRVLRYALDENEFLSPYGLRSVSRRYKDDPFVFQFAGQEYSVRYEPGESVTSLFGGNSNWRGPVWMPMNFLFIEALERYYHFFGEGFQMECPTGSGRLMNLSQIARELTRRLIALFTPDEGGRRPINGGDPLFDDPYFRDLLLFHEYFHGDTGRGCGASHQTGWTALIGRLIEDTGRREARAERERRRAAPAVASAGPR